MNSNNFIYIDNCIVSCDKEELAVHSPGPNKHAKRTYEFFLSVMPQITEVFMERRHFSMLVQLLAQVLFIQFQSILHDTFTSHSSRKWPDFYLYFLSHVTFDRISSC